MCSIKKQYWSNSFLQSIPAARFFFVDRLVTLRTQALIWFLSNFSTFALVPAFYVCFLCFLNQQSWFHQQWLACITDRLLLYIRYVIIILLMLFIHDYFTFKRKSRKIFLNRKNCFSHFSLLIHSRQQKIQNWNVFSHKLCEYIQCVIASVNNFSLSGKLKNFNRGFFCTKAN